jgi:amidase
MARNFSDALRLYAAMRGAPLPEYGPRPLSGLRLAVNLANMDRLPAEETAFLQRLLGRLRAGGAVIGELMQPPSPALATIMKWEFGPALENYLRRSSAALKTLTEIVAFYEAHPASMQKYGVETLRAALYETPGGLRGEPYRAALESRRESSARVTAEISEYDAVLMTGPTNIMHLCGLPSATVADRERTEAGVRQAVILYGADEARLYEAALTLERELR